MDPPHNNYAVLLLPVPLLVAVLIYFAGKYQPWITLSERAPSPKRALVGFLLCGAITFLAVSACCYPGYGKIVDIRDHGQRAMAAVENIYRLPSKGGAKYDVQYRYAVPQRDGTVSYFNGLDWLPRTSVLDAQKTGQVPIVYATDNPGLSLVNYDDYVFLGALSAQRKIMLFLATLPAILIGVFAAIIFNKSAIDRRQRL